MSAPVYGSFEAAWDGFLASDGVHAGAPASGGEMAQGRAQLLAFVVPLLDREARAAVSRFSDVLRDLGCLAFEPEHHWHVTVKMIGFQVVRRSREDEVLRQDVASMLYAAERALAGVQPFEVELGPANAFPDAVVLEVHDGGGMAALHNRLLEALPNCPRFPFDGDAYLPHLTVALFASSDGLPDLKQRLTERRGETVATTLVRRVDLVKVWFTDERPEVDLVQPIALGRGR